MIDAGERRSWRTVTVPARQGKGLAVERGGVFRVINTHGSQVVDLWAFSDADPAEFMAMEHSRVTLGRWRPAVGNALVTNRRRPILTITADTTPGVHDTTFAACDRYRYELLGHPGYHDNCTDNLAAVLKEHGRPPRPTPCPLNLFMNVGFEESGEMIVRPPVAGAGQFVEFRAEMDCFVALSSCPQDLVPVNGIDCVPRSVEIAVRA